MSTIENYHDESNINRNNNNNNNNNNNDIQELNTTSLQNINIEFKKNNCSQRKKKIVIGVIVGSLIIVGAVVALIFYLKKKDDDNSNSICKENSGLNCEIDSSSESESSNLKSESKSESSSSKCCDSDSSSSSEEYDIKYYKSTLLSYSAEKKVNSNLSLESQTFSSENKINSEYLLLISDEISNFNEKKYFEAYAIIKSKTNEKEDLNNFDNTNFIFDNNLNSINSNNALCKLYFYKNGTIKEIQFHEKISSENKNELNDFISGIIPIITKKYYENKRNLNENNNNNNNQHEKKNKKKNKKNKHNKENSDSEEEKENAKKIEKKENENEDNEEK
jgi:hypothetical protein